MKPQITLIGVPRSRVSFRSYRCSISEREETNWQVIFKIKINDRITDYCRETKSGSMSANEVEQWAEEQITEHSLHSAVIERW